MKQSFNFQKSLKIFEAENVVKTPKPKPRTKLDNLMDFIIGVVNTDGKMLVKNPKALAKAVNITPFTLAKYIQKLGEFGLEQKNVKCKDGTSAMRIQPKNTTGDADVPVPFETVETQN